MKKSLRLTSAATVMIGDTVEACAILAGIPRLVTGPVTALDTDEGFIRVRTVTRGSLWIFLHEVIRVKRGDTEFIIPSRRN